MSSLELSCSAEISSKCGQILVVSMVSDSADKTKTFLILFFRSGRSRKELGLLRLSQRSNGLAFSHLYYLMASSVPLSKPRNSVLFDRSGNVPANLREGAAPLCLEP